jgi:hypothetical protein
MAASGSSTLCRKGRKEMKKLSLCACLSVLFLISGC